MSEKSIEDLARRLAEAVPEGLRSVRKDLEENFQSVLKSGLGKLDLVTREEFEVQEAVLLRTREKLAERVPLECDTVEDARRSLTHGPLFAEDRGGQMV